MLGLGQNESRAPYELLRSVLRGVSARAAVHSRGLEPQLEHIWWFVRLYLDPAVAETPLWGWDQPGGTQGRFWDRGDGPGSP